MPRGGLAALLAVAIGLWPATGRAAPPIGYLDGASCDGISGWSQDPDETDKAIDVHIYIGGPAGSPSAVAFGTNAGIHRDDLCSAIGSCAHGFVTLSPLSLHDGQSREVYAYGIDSQGGPNPVLGSTPKTLSCGAGSPTGIKRRVDGVATFDAWRFSSFWDLLPLGPAEADTLAEGPELPVEPELWVSEDGTPPGVWLVDGGVRRAVSDAAAAIWRLDLATAVAKPPAELNALVEGTPLRPRPVIFIGGGLYLIDDPQPEGSSTSSSGAGPTGTSGAGSGGSGAGGSGSAGDGDGSNEADAGSPSGESCAVRSGDPRTGGGWMFAAAALAWALLRRRTWRIGG